MNNPPIKMILQPTQQDIPKEVDVYDFMHDTYETFQSLALCWDPKGKVWYTVPVASLIPIENKPKKTKLNEKVDNT